ncbi:MAG: polysaccharide deacetylase family protein [Desulfobacterota bacterium]|nr:polysaccharide deacetylase family protein [Thermodesulfobacteriota bacterium]
MTLTRRDFLKGTLGAFLISPGRGRDREVPTKRIPVLLYHDISNSVKDDYTLSPAQFAAQMEWLYSEGYQALLFREVPSLPEEQLERKVVITFDDGYASFIDYAFPLLQSYQFKAILNPIGAHVGTFIPMGTNRPLLSWDEYRYLLKTGLVELGCHTYELHHSKGALSVSASRLESDLQRFQEVAQRETGRRVQILAWPYGYFDRQSVRVAKKVGFQYLLTSEEGLFERASGWDRIPRLNINYKLDLVSFKQYLGRKEQ